MKPRNILILLVILLGLGGYFYFTKPSQPPPKEEPQVFVWSIEMEDIQHIDIELPREGERQSFLEEADESWHFDDPQRSPVDMNRWGGGIPLLLSGPRAARIIAENASLAKLAEFGLAQPRMKITLTLKDGSVMTINVGDRTPGGEDFYVQAPGSNDVALVDYSWYEVVERLVKKPPYLSPPTKLPTTP